MIAGSIVVTGSSQGIGRAIVEAFVNKGVRVLGVSRQSDPPVAGLHHVRFDLAMLDRIPDLWLELTRRADDIAVLVLNAGIGNIRRLIDEDYGNCTRVINLNFLSPYLLAREAVAYWQRGHVAGHLIFIGSQAGLPGCAQAYNSLYSASKAAIHSLVGSLSRELAPTIRVNAIAPGDVFTQLAQESGSDLVHLLPGVANSADYEQMVVRRSLLQRWVHSEEIASAVQYLVENEAVTGTILNVSAGTTIY